MNGKLFRHLVIAAALVLALASGSVPVASAQAPADFIPGEILVKFKPGSPGARVADAHRQNGGQVQETVAGIDVQVVRVPTGQEAARVAAYARNPNVLFAERNGVYHAAWMPNDPKLGQQWQYGRISASAAWDVTTGSSTVAIAILDSGIDQSHEDLMAKVVKNKNYSTSKTVDDKYGHGTHVAGSAASVTNNGVGVAGTCPGCVLYNVKVINDSGMGSWSAVANGITWAADNGARVISLSLGGGASSTVEAAVNYAWGKGAVVTAAAGNYNTADPFYPAAYANAIAIAATDNNDARASFSNYGSWVDVAAPGVNILSTAPDHKNRVFISGVKYGTLSGTSMATPHVAGVAGLVWSTGVCGSDNACVRSRVETRADAVAGTGTYWTYGRINAASSVAP